MKPCINRLQHLATPLLILKGEAASTQDPPPKTVEVGGSVGLWYFNRSLIFLLTLQISSSESPVEGSRLCYEVLKLLLCDKALPG